MNLKKLLEKYKPPDKTDDVLEIPLEWLGEEPVETVEETNEVVVEESVWPPVQSSRKLDFSFNYRRVTVLFAKILFVLYVLLSVGVVTSYPFMLVLFLPTALVCAAHVKDSKTMNQISTWFKPDENFDDEYSNSSSEE